MKFTWKGDGEILKFVTSLQILLFLNNRSIVFKQKIYCSFLQMGVVCGHNNGMIPNI